MTAHTPPSQRRQIPLTGNTRPRARTSRRRRPSPALDQFRAIARAIAAIPVTETGMRRWYYADAVRIGGYWTCVLNDHLLCYLVHVHIGTGYAQIIQITPTDRWRTAQ